MVSTAQRAAAPGVMPDKQFATSFHGKDGASAGIKHVKDRRRSMPEVTSLIDTAHLPRSRQVDVRRHQADDLERKIAEKRNEMRNKAPRSGRTSGDAVSDFLNKTPAAQSYMQPASPPPPPPSVVAVHEPAYAAPPVEQQQQQPPPSQPPPPPAHLVPQSQVDDEHEQQQRAMLQLLIKQKEQAEEEMRYQEQQKLLLQQQYFLEQQKQQLAQREELEQQILRQQQMQARQQEALVVQQRQLQLDQAMEDEKKKHNMKVYEEMFPELSRGAEGASPTPSSPGAAATNGSTAAADTGAHSEDKLRSLHMRLGADGEHGGHGGIEDERTRRALERKLKLSSATASESTRADRPPVKEDKESLIAQAKEAIRSDLKSIISRRTEASGDAEYEGTAAKTSGRRSSLAGDFKTYLEKDCARLRSEVKALQAEKDELAATNVELKSKNADNERSLAEAQKKVSMLEGAPDVREELRVVKDLNAVLSAEVHSLKKSRNASNPQHRIEVDALREMVERLRESNKELLQKNSDLDQQLADEVRRGALAKGSGGDGIAESDAGVMQEVARLREANETLAAHNAQLLNQKLELEAVHSENSSLTLQLAEARQQLETMQLEQQKAVQEQRRLQTEVEESEASKLKEVTAEIQRLVSGRGREDIMRLENDVRQLQHQTTTTRTDNGTAGAKPVFHDASMNGLDRLVGARSPLVSTFNNSSSAVDDVATVIDALSGQTLLNEFVKRSAEAADFMRVGRILRKQGESFHHAVVFSDLVFKRSLISGTTEKALLVVTDQTLLLMNTVEKAVDWETSLTQVTTITLTKDDGDETFMIETIEGDRVVLDSPRRDIAVGSLVKSCQALGLKLGLVQNQLGLVISREF